MRVSLYELGRRMKDVLLAPGRSESITIYYRGKEKAIRTPSRKRTEKSVMDHAPFGMWRERKDMADVDAYVRNQKMRPG